MVAKKKLKPKRTTTFGSLRRLAVFQVKLAADAMRDIMLSPISIVVYVIDALAGLEDEQSLHRGLMRLGQRSDRFINLFEEYNDAPHTTIDNTIDGLETRILKESVSDGGSGKITDRQPEAR